MAELTQEQVERAANVMCPLNWDVAGAEEKSTYRERVRAATPFLQLPLEKVSEQEWHAALVFEVKWKGGASDGVRAMLDAFVINRNVALLPKPVDPRKAKIVLALQGLALADARERMAELIILALDAQ